LSCGAAEVTIAAVQKAALRAFEFALSRHSQPVGHCPFFVATRKTFDVDARGGQAHAFVTKAVMKPGGAGDHGLGR
jgi:hypothetical protein